MKVIQVLRGRLAGSGRGKIVALHRGQRRRQDDHAEGHLGNAEDRRGRGHRAAASMLGGKRIDRSARRTSPDGHEPGHGRTPGAGAPERRGEPARRRLLPERPGRHQEDLEMVFDYFPRIKRLRKRISGYLSGGEQQMLVIGRALMARPRLMLLDEPSLGLAPLVVRGDLRDHQEDQRLSRRWPCCWWSRTSGRPGHRGLRLCHGERQDRPERPGRKA